MNLQDLRALQQQAAKYRAWHSRILANKAFLGRLSRELQNRVKALHDEANTCHEFFVRCETDSLSFNEELWIERVESLAPKTQDLERRVLHHIKTHKAHQASRRA